MEHMYLEFQLTHRFSQQNVDCVLQKNRALNPDSKKF
jgi:hypothetical protein